MRAILLARKIELPPSVIGEASRPDFVHRILPEAEAIVVAGCE
jgi:hypothetical protein